MQTLGVFGAVVMLFLVASPFGATGQELSAADTEADFGAAGLLRMGPQYLRS